jgi:transposase InsO family protein
MTNDAFRGIEKLEADLWEAADNLRANSKLKSSDYFMPVLGVIFLRHGANRLDAKVGIERWRRHYNEERPHMSLGDQTPAEFKAQATMKNGWLQGEPGSAVLQ